MTGIIRLAALVLAGMLALSAPAASAATYTATSTVDSWINEASVNQNNATVTTLRATATTGNASRTRALIAFTLPTIPSNEAITSVTLKLVVTTVGTKTVTVNRLNAAWTETGVTWSNFSVNNFNAAAEASFTPSATGSISVDVTSLVQGWYNGTFTNNGLGLIGAAGSNAIFASGEATAANRPQLVITTALIQPVFGIVRVSNIISDPLNSGTNPKLIPGAVVGYALTFSNSSAGTADNNSTVMTEAVPSTMKLYVGDVAGAGSGPVAFTNGSTSSGLTYTYTSLASTTDSLSFSNNGGSTFAYVPVADASGYDSTVTHIRVSPTGTFAGKTGATSPSATIQFRLQVK